MTESSSVVIRVREYTKGSTGAATVMWSVLTAACLFGLRAGIGRSFFGWALVIGTVVYAAYLGWHRRVGVIFAAPVASWLFAWFPIIVAEMIRDGFFRGFFVGLAIDTVGWLAVGTAEVAALLVISFPFRLVARANHRDSVVTIKNPL